MEQRKLSELTNQELLQEAKKRRTTAILNAVLIGVLIGIIVYSVMLNSWGWLTLILLYVIYRMVNKSKRDSRELDDLLKERNLK